MTYEEKLKSKLVTDDNGCWVYTGCSRGKGGYGGFWMNGDNRYVHRVAYEMWVEPIPEDGFIHHKCSNRRCCNPEHLQCTAWNENYAEMYARQQLLSRIQELEKELEVYRNGA